MFKLVNGISVTCSVEEANAIQAEWNAYVPAVKVKAPTLQDVIAVLSPTQKTALDTIVSTKE